MTTRKVVSVCHGNSDSYRLRDSGLGFQPFMGQASIYKLRIGPQGGNHWEHIGNYSSPDNYRRYVPGSNRTVFRDPKPWPDLKWCDECGFIFEGGIKVGRDFGFGWFENFFPDDWADNPDFNPALRIGWSK